jgi:uncharacterized protein YdiU (UPF0061 family)
MPLSPEKADRPAAAFPFDNSYARLPAHFQLPQRPAAATKPRLIKFNRPLAIELGLDVEALDDATAASIFGGVDVPLGAEPLAMAYAGHQFGQFVPQLGDGRAILLGEVIDQNGTRRDIQLKGGGPTPFSRRGDGRAALGPVLREYIVSEAMYALGIPTTRALAAVATGEPVYRQTELPGAVFTRVAASHIRVGTFQFFAARGDIEAIRTLADYVIDRHYPDIHEAGHPYVALLEAIIERQASLVARWMSIGFIHGVMNTDNMTISGETIDFGPCAFMDAYDPAKVFSSIDQRGRYAYQNQPSAAQWNLARLAETFLPLLDPDPDQAVSLANDLVVGFAERYQLHWLNGMRDKLGLFTEEDGDQALIEGLLDLMHRNQADFTLTFRGLCDAALGDAGVTTLRKMFADTAAFDLWIAEWRARMAREDEDETERAEVMRDINPLFIPRNHQIEAVIAAAIERNDFTPFEEMVEALANPYEQQDRFTDYARPPLAEEQVFQTFCGT